LDIGSTGTVKITGNLLVIGDSTQVNTTNMTVTDNVILLNQELNSDGTPKTHTGVTNGTSGIEIERGTLPNAKFFWDDTKTVYEPVGDTTVRGVFVAGRQDGSYAGLQLSSLIAGNSDIAVALGDAFVLRVVSDANDGYESLVTDSNDIPNRKFVTDYVNATGGTANVDNIHNLFGPETARVQAGTSNIEFTIDGDNRATVTSTGFAIDNVFRSGDTITDTSSGNLVLTANSNNIEIEAVLNLNNQVSTPPFETGTTKVYSTASEGPGRTGIYFINDVDYGANNYNADELVSKNRAVLLSILL
jgi:hypothetical protein